LLAVPRLTSMSPVSLVFRAGFIEYNGHQRLWAIAVQN
jgi:hypothetical protein